MISKELLSEVLNINDIKEYECRDNECHIVRHDLPLPMGNQHILINIYELAHKCKEWADDEGYTIQSWIFGKHDSGKAKIIGLISDFQSDDLPLISADTEHEAIFKACEWILEKGENNDK